MSLCFFFVAFIYLCFCVFFSFKNVSSFFLLMSKNYKNVKKMFNLKAYTNNTRIFFFLLLLKWNFNNKYHNFKKNNNFNLNFKKINSRIEILCFFIFRHLFFFILLRFIFVLKLKTQPLKKINTRQTKFKSKDSSRHNTLFIAHKF